MTAPRPIAGDNTKDKTMNEALPYHMCKRVDRLMSEADELVDHLLCFARDHDCSYALVELKRIQARADSAIQFIEGRKEDGKAA